MLPSSSVTNCQRCQDTKMAKSGRTDEKTIICLAPVLHLVGSSAHHTGGWAFASVFVPRLPVVLHLKPAMYLRSIRLKRRRGLCGLTCSADHSPSVPRDGHRCSLLLDMQAYQQVPGTLPVGAKVSCFGHQQRHQQPWRRVAGIAHCSSTVKTTKSSMAMSVRLLLYAMAKAVPCASLWFVACIHPPLGKHSLFYHAPCRSAGCLQVRKKSITVTCEKGLSTE